MPITRNVAGRIKFVERKIMLPRRGELIILLTTLRTILNKKSTK